VSYLLNLPPNINELIASSGPSPRIFILNIDDSGSVEAIKPRICDIVKTILRATRDVGPRYSPLTLINFFNADVFQPLVPSKECRGVKAERFTAMGGTPLYPSINDCGRFLLNVADAFRKAGKGNVGGAVATLTDGKDDGSSSEDLEKLQALTRLVNPMERFSMNAICIENKEKVDIESELRVAGFEERRIFTASAANTDSDADKLRRFILTMVHSTLRS
jgi:hypothetical protein